MPDFGQKGATHVANRPARGDPEGAPRHSDQGQRRGPRLHRRRDRDDQQEGRQAAELKLGIERAEESRRDLAEITGGVSYIDDGNGNIYEDSPGGGEKTFFALSGDRGEKAAAGIARQMRGEFGSKALTPVGQMLSNQVFDPIPIDTQKVPNSIITILNVRVRETATWRGIRQAGFVNRASIVPPGATKPTTAISIEPVDHSLAVLAHLTEPVDKFLLEDNSHLVDFIDRNMLFGLEDARG